MNTGAATVNRGEIVSMYAGLKMLRCRCPLPGNCANDQCVRISLNGGSEISVAVGAGVTLSIISYWFGRLVGHQPLVVYLCVCVSADMSSYCSAHDEWLLLMKLLSHGVGTSV